jgi:uncharacterized membrane protein YoaK (UPF0700 family)
MTGNLLLVAFELKEFMVEEMLLTFVLIITYVSFGAIYDAVIIHLQEDETKVLIFLILAILPLGALADVLQYVTSACSVSDKDGACTGHQLYFLVPVSAIAGLIAAGYFPSHPDSIITTLMTGHMRVPSNAVVRLIMEKNMDKAASDLLKWNLWTSFFVVSSSFSGALLGVFTTAWIKEAYKSHIFVPIFTLFGFIMAFLCIIHCKSCSKFYKFHRELRRQVTQRDQLAYSTIISKQNEDRCLSDDGFESFDF